MWMTIASVILFEIGLNWFVVFVLLGDQAPEWAFLGLWIVHLFDETMRLAANYWRFKGGKWKFLHV
jgi:Na+-driven multidrug efflux pump